ncbi:cytochrome p450 monooxygenase [Teratosphaeria nubilosa]|uniref:Cytochrome p450 monooxygenase n=1 Tax=Teratosphaeria nubilosa TaxID=161662 RepID=A0A6G1LMR6_9PEZI|nr:cytochrome p450 monooxygenase [Teratosphaeria nubilosa]
MAATLITPLSAVGILLVICLTGWRLRNVGRRPDGMPPGPATLPVLGNLHQIPARNAHLQFRKWADEYGPVYSIMLGTIPTVVLTSDVAVRDLLEKRGQIYSDRPDMFLSQVVASGNLRLVVMRYGDSWRLIHRLVHNILNISVAAKYIPYQDLESKYLLGGLLDTPESFKQHLRRFAFSLSTQLIFGYRCPSYTDPRIEKLFQIFEGWAKVSESGAGKIADVYPILQSLPRFLLPGVREAEHVHKIGRKLYTDQWLAAKEDLKNGKGTPCICNDLLLAQQSEGLSDEVVAYIVGSLLEGGSDTTSATTYGFVEAMMCFPEAQKKAQEEIDRVVGSDRLPTIDDYPDLPYIRCVIKETLRWMPPVILGVPHRVTKDDEYMGWKIPKDATVLNNVWGIQMDPIRSPNPRHFLPERHLGDTTTLYESARGDPLKRDNFNFGAGRRMCQGVHIAERSLFLAMSRILWGFNIEKPLDANGAPITPDIDDFEGGIAVTPAPFGVEIKARSVERTEIMKRALEDCEGLIDAATGQWKKPPEGMPFGAAPYSGGFREKE